MDNQTFSLPSSLDNLTLLDIWDHHGKYSSDHPIFRCTPAETDAAGRIVTWGEATCAMHAAGRVILDALVENRVFGTSADAPERPVVGILAVSGLFSIL